MKKPKRTKPSSHNRRKDLNEVRIIGGSHRGRKLRFPDAAGLRPTGDRIRETLFNWLQPRIRGSRCLDAFAGSGALGFEAASRGATGVVMLDNSPAAFDTLQSNQAQLKLPGVEIEQRDALAWLLDSAPIPFDILFLDPPFSEDLMDETLALIAKRGWLVQTGLAYVENGKGHAPSVPGNWELLKEKKTGQVEYRLWRNDSGAND